MYAGAYVAGFGMQVAGLAAATRQLSELAPCLGKVTKHMHARACLPGHSSTNSLRLGPFAGDGAQAAWVHSGRVRLLMLAFV